MYINIYIYFFFSCRSSKTVNISSTGEFFHHGTMAIYHERRFRFWAIHRKKLILNTNIIFSVLQYELLYSLKLTFKNILISCVFCQRKQVSIKSHSSKTFKVISLNSNRLFHNTFFSGQSEHQSLLVFRKEYIYSIMTKTSIMKRNAIPTCILMSLYFY